MSHNLIFRAGDKAIQRLRDGGLHSDEISTIAGAAGGPKSLILTHLDITLFSHFFAARNAPLFLIGSSIGSWRFAAACRSDPTDALQIFQEEYISQQYSDHPSPSEISQKSREFRDILLRNGGADEILRHPSFRLGIMSSRCRGLLARERRSLQMTGVFMTFLLNMFHRHMLGYCTDRVLFNDPRSCPPFSFGRDIPFHRVDLTHTNIADALLASGSIPVIMHGVSGIHGAPPGLYRDGGIIDYHMDIPFDENGIVLFPHYMERIIPGWFDKRLGWRKPAKKHMENVLLVAPSHAFINTLPSGKIPDRKDFTTFRGHDDERRLYWRKTLAQGERLGDEFLEAVTTGELSRRVKPLAVSP